MEITNVDQSENYTIVMKIIFVSLDIIPTYYVILLNKENYI